MKRRVKWSLVAIVVMALGAGGYLYWQHERLYPSTSDAYIKANVARISAQVTGLAANVYVSDHQPVRAGQPLVEIDPATYRIAVDEAQARLDLVREQNAAAEAAVNAARAMVKQRQAELTDTRKNTQRTLNLVQRGDLPPSDKDDAKAALKTGRAALAAANAELVKALRQRGDVGKDNARLRAAAASLAQAHLDLSHTLVSAPADGVVGEVKLRPGSPVNANDPLFPLVETGTWWVEANFKETDLHRIRPGQPANVGVDLFPGKTFHGVVDSVSPASGVAFSLLPPENATGNWVKVTQRFPVKIRVTADNMPLRVGASCTVTVDTTHNP